MTWAAILVCGAGCYLLKLGGMSVPPRILEHPRVRQVADLLPVALLAALIAVQVFTGGTEHDTRLTVDARLAGLGTAALALLLRAPFLLVVVVAATTAALVRLL